MFAKKLLSVVSALFIGAQFAQAAKIAGCDDGGVVGYSKEDNCSAGDIDHYCTKGNYIFAVVSGGASCVEIVKNKVAVFDSDKLVDLTIYTAGNGILADVESSGGEDLTIYDCDKDGKCTRTYGFVKDVVTGDDTKYYKVAQGADGTEITSDMSTESAGKLYTGGLLYVDTTASHAINIGANDGKYYVVTDADQVFNNGGGSQKVLVKSGLNTLTYVDVASSDKNYLAIDNTGVIGSKVGDIIVVDEDVAVDQTFDGEVDYCVDEKWQIWNRKDGLCGAYITSGEDCTFYYNCKKGKECTVSDTNVDPRQQDRIPTAGNSNECDEGYYLLNSSNTELIKTTDDGTYHLWECGEDDCNDITGSAPLGYLKNSGDNSADVPYIECNKTKCVMAKIAASASACVSENPTALQVTYGGLYKSGDNYKLCRVYTDTTSSPEIDTSAKGKYFVSVGNNSNIFGLAKQTGNFVAIEIDDVNGNIKVVKDDVRYRYTLANEYLIHDRSEAKDETEPDEICDGSTTPFEYILNKWDGLPTDASYYIQEQ